ncbi:hypothetical protein X777_11084 [Ooceraea biroi]|uniref:Uncharacterized protein n=1 Tax=Ooceraea biroi TaxID=2015173 RepID=A0A026W3Q7_OOCBI|nr:hypothetical protein X777_11084 [Ooceraea biroi]
MVVVVPVPGGGGGGVGGGGGGGYLEHQVVPHTLHSYPLLQFPHAAGVACTRHDESPRLSSAISLPRLTITGERSCTWKIDIGIRCIGNGKAVLVRIEKRSSSLFLPSLLNGTPVARERDAYRSVDF